MQGRRIPLLGLCGGLALFACSGQELPGSAPETKSWLAPSSSESPGPTAMPPVLAMCFGEGGVNSVTSDEFVQTYTIVNFRDVHVSDLPFDRATGDWGSITDYSDSTSYDITCAGNNGRDWFYFAGEAANGDCVVEVWRLEPLNAAASGEPQPRKRFVKTEIYRGTEVALPVVQVEADPKRRFVILLAGPSGDRRLYTLGHGAGSTPRLLYDSQSLPELADADQLWREQRPEGSRVWRASGLASNTIIFRDEDDDGIFEHPPDHGY